ncbi:MAG: Fur family transcriptional regulator [Anaerolineaceae bacterium]|jgi:Fur family ferric uptake transcriptional regulator
MNWQKALTEQGYRLSTPRKQVMAYLENKEKPMTPLAIHQGMRQQGSNASLASVYRNLELLYTLGLLRAVYDPEGNLGYMVASGGHYHHILCKFCHKAVEFSGSEDLSMLIRQVEKETCYDVSGHLLQLYGYCPECKSKGFV